jgi:hypothetical protein
MNEPLTMEQQFSGKELTDAQWADVLKCNVANITEIREFLQSYTKVSVEHENGKYVLYKYDTDTMFPGKHTPNGIPLDFVWLPVARTQSEFKTYNQAKDFAYQKWIPSIDFPTKTNNGKEIPKNAHLMFMVTDAPQIFMESDGFSPAICYMTRAEQAMYKKYHTR